MNKTLTKTLITLFLVFAMIITVDAFYSAISLGNQLAHASIASAGLTLLIYAAVFITCIVAIVTVWKKKK